MQRINTKEEFEQFSIDQGVRPDWHEPDEQRLTARVTGTHLDNAMGTDPYSNCGEMVVIFERLYPQRGEETQFACVNLANLLSWARI